MKNPVFLRVVHVLSHFRANFEVFEVFTKIDDPIKRISADKKRHNFYSLLKLNEIDRGGLHFEVFRR